MCSGGSHLLTEVPFFETKNRRRADGPPPWWKSYFAFTVTVGSRRTWTVVVPGDSNYCAILLARSRARMTIWSSLTCSGLTMTRTSRPAWMA